MKSGAAAFLEIEAVIVHNARYLICPGGEIGRRTTLRW